MRPVSYAFCETLLPLTFDRILRIYPPSSSQRAAIHVTILLHHNLKKNKTETSCRFIDDANANRYCGAPTLPGSAYCGRHHRLCLVAPASPEGGRAIGQFERDARQPPPLPAALAYLATVAVPEELDSADEPRDLAGCIDLFPNDDRSDE
jgi:hypothetical protein